MTVLVHGSPIAVDDVGKGEPIVFLHGFPLNRRMWQAQTAALAGTHRVITPDLSGFGESVGAPPAATMDAWADDIAALLDALKIDEPVTLCGLSMGGYIALAFAERHRHRLGRLILCDTRADADPPEKKADREETARLTLENGVDQLVQEMPVSLLSEQTIAENPSIVTGVREMIAEAPPASVAAALRGMAERPDRTGLLSQINVPTLVICGEDDAISPVAVMRPLADAIPDAIFATIPLAGHLAPIENAESVNAAIRRFLEGAS